MIIRLVKMSFQPQESTRFLSLYKQVHPKILSFPGCVSVELLHEVHDEHAYTTYSLWQNNDALEAYRQSDFFKATWTEVRKMLRSKTLAISYRKVEI
ncbi:Antibiotic biosynthesis monooxygenase [Chloroherpeton thalassium ATCC 35110]|uniref:Antibiotic biosynthesis monooxygenase n=1 Tax=Chloroherpeton thalassium (strain ATCC 35110 / GB-78) TaxID=517418 RepID=B3QUY8_CHLT3|nr:antibiotic biosynthesis monooxygenase family protein [Chloroherpeton thalassium]ACF14489.1 Antibiotic biosynthesis monooxygenase [Chloroherpeton thalassium ATCC 35110]